LVLVLDDELLFSSRIEMGLRGSGYRGRVVTRLERFSEALKCAPVLILVNIGTAHVSWPQMIALAKARRLAPLAAAVGYGPHTDLVLRERALTAGCDAVVARSAIASGLPSLLERYAWRPDLSACDRALPTSVSQGITQFNRREFYACHDTIERVWVGEPGDIRLMYQGILQIGVAFHHVQNGNWSGMVKMMARGTGKLLPFQPSCQGIDLKRLLEDIERCEAAMRGLGSESLARFDSFPAIRVTR
jgi:CheY-like chemotaxis protein